MNKKKKSKNIHHICVQTFILLDRNILLIVLNQIFCQMPLQPSSDDKINTVLCHLLQ